MRTSNLTVPIFCLCWTWLAGVVCAAETAQLSVDQGHPWRPPFGLDRVGASFEVLLNIAEPVASSSYHLSGMRDGAQVFEQTFAAPDGNPCVRRFDLTGNPAGLVLRDGQDRELARLTVQPPRFEAAIEARADPVRNPVDLGAILPPADWLLLGRDQAVAIDVAALSRDSAIAFCDISAWFESNPDRKASGTLTLHTGSRAATCITIARSPDQSTSDILYVAFKDPSGNVLHERRIRVMLAEASDDLPAFGATETTLRYDAPISVRDADDSFGTIAYDTAWDASLKDVVVSLPNGARFVFWRGSSYVPFWAGLHNAGMSYEWAETTPPKDGFTDCVEPLMDKELRYGRVEIIESTESRVHVRWTYQSCDFLYKVWGDSAQEDYVFYRDGLGTRTLTLVSDLDADYELSEFIILTPASTYPLRVVPEHVVDILFADGEVRAPRVPFDAATQGDLMKTRELPMMFRVRYHRDEPLAAIYFHPTETKMPHGFFGPFYDQGQMVTPCYWGSHWPLARGQTTGGAINARMTDTPCHNSLLTWARVRPEPLRTARYVAPDTLGRSGPRLSQTWTWLIGASEADNARLVQWMRSFASPPSIEAEGARIEADSFSQERRALRLIVERNDVTLRLTPNPVCVNPVLELRNAPRGLERVTVNGATLETAQYAWDGHVLWIDHTFDTAVTVTLMFVKR